MSQNFAGLLTRVDQRGTASVIASTPGFETSAVSSRNGTVYFTKTAPDHSSSVLMARSPNGTITQVADLWAHENSENPDSVNAYGFSGLDADCLAQFPPAGPMTNAPAYNGIVDTNPYSSLALKDAIYVADAGANAIWRVGYDGTVTTVAVLPPTAPIHVTAEIAAGRRLPGLRSGSRLPVRAGTHRCGTGPERLALRQFASGRSRGCEPGRSRCGVQDQPAERHDPDGRDRIRRDDGHRGITRSGTVYVAELFGGAGGAGQVSVVLPGAHTPRLLVA